MELTTLPESVSTALLAAALASLGFVGKQIFESIVVLRTARQARRARLVSLLSLLQGSAAVYRVQAKLRNRLFDTVTQRCPDLAAKHKGYDAIFSAAFPTMDNEERQLHSLIRAYTVSGLKPLNEALIQWLQSDTEFKYARFRTPPSRRLALQLEELEPHLLMWLAKYAAWIPESPAHALVYLADEEDHGVPFPRGIEGTITQVLKVPPTYT
jgi:hypothetical protein